MEPVLPAKSILDVLKTKHILVRGNGPKALRDQGGPLMSSKALDERLVLKHEIQIQGK